MDHESAIKHNHYYYEKVILRLSEHGDVIIETQTTQWLLFFHFGSIQSTVWLLPIKKKLATLVDYRSTRSRWCIRTECCRVRLVYRLTVSLMFVLINGL